MCQLIIARKDLKMSTGKLTAQVAHAAMAFITRPMREGAGVVVTDDTVEITCRLDRETYEEWICGIFTKTVCEARNRNQLMKAVALAEELGLVENEDFFLIRDACLTELEPEEMDEDGTGRTLTCIGFRPLPDEVAHAISRKFQLYR